MGAGMTVVNVDGLRGDPLESSRYERGRWGAFLTGLGAVLGGTFLATSHTQPVAVGVGLALMGLACLVPYVDHFRRPIRSGPPIDPDGEIAAVEAAVHHRIAMTDEEVARLRSEIEERDDRLDAFVCMLGGVSEAVAQRAERFRKTS